MRAFAFLAALAGLTACGGGSEASVSGTAGGVTLGDATSVYFGGPYVVIAAGEVDCIDLAWVRKNYEEGITPTASDVEALQFAFSTTDVEVGRVTVGITASASSTMVKVADGAATFTRAEGGVLDIASVDPTDDGIAEGSFEGLAFADGTLDGTFTATWCRNLRD